MAARKETLYDVLGLPREASHNDVLRTHRKLVKEMEKESAAPNPRRAALLHEAYEVLGDPVRREAYDRSLREPRLLGIKGGEKPVLRWTLAVGALTAALAGTAWFVLYKDEAPPERAAAPPTVSATEVQAAALVAVGRLDRVEISGARTPLGMAVAVEQGVMLAPCKGLTPGAQLVVRVPPRDIPAQVGQADEAIGLCKLLVSGGASWPLAMTALEPRAGDPIYAAGLDAKGDVVITPGEVTRVERGTIGRVIEVTARAGKPPEGSPLLDADGRVVAIALEGRHTMLPKEWIVDLPRKRPPPEEKAAEPAEAEAPPAADPNEDPRLRNIPPERRKRLEEAFRPPPSVPDDI